MKPNLMRLGLVVLCSLAMYGCGGGGAKPDVEVPIEGIVVGIPSSEGRRPKLRADIVLVYPGGTDTTRIAGAEGKAAVLKGLSALPTVEEIEKDMQFAIDEAADSVKSMIQQEGLEPPQAVRVVGFIIQG